MYLEHWGLPMRPFESLPDPRFYYRSAPHEGALAKLHYAVQNRLGMGLLWGPAGTGKTLVLEVLRERLDPSAFYVVSVSLADESAEGLLYAFLAGLGETELSPLRGRVIPAALMGRLAEWLEAVRQSGRHTVLLLDEAHLLRDRRSLETLRVLLNTPPNAERLMTAVVAGQEELGSRVARFTSLDERVDVRAPLGSLSEEEAMAYLLHRIEVAGGRRGVFTRDAARELARAAHCLPGKLNRLGEMCLATAFAAGLDRVGPNVVSAVMEDVRAAPGGASADTATGGEEASP